jgi:lysophospholipase L1-like esterase
MAIVEAYLDPKTGSPVAAGVVPLWGQSTMKGLYRALPIYDIMHDEEIQKEISTRDLDRVREVHSLITSIMLDKDLSLDQVQKKYYLFPEGYVRSPVPPIELSERMKSTQLYRLLSKARSVCFVGDSITKGSKNGGYGWYEPLAAAFPNLLVYQRAWDSHTVKMLLERTDEILDVSADVYVIAIGTNDVRYRDANVSSMTPEEYIQNVDQLVQKIQGRHRDAKIVLISAWTTDHHDPVSAIDEKERMEMLSQYRAAIKSYADGRQFLSIDPNPGIEKVLRSEYPPKYLIDHIHPNADQGIRLYSEKVLEASD